MLNRLSYYIDELRSDDKIDYDVYLNLREMSDQLGDENAALRERLDKAQKRVAVLERAIRIYQTQYGDVRFFNFDVAIKQAEKELKGDE